MSMSDLAPINANEYLGGLLDFTGEMTTDLEGLGDDRVSVKVLGSTKLPSLILQAEVKQGAQLDNPLVKADISITRPDAAIGNTETGKLILKEPWELSAALIALTGSVNRDWEC